MFIEKCSICGENIATIFSLPFEDIIGMAHDYEQNIGYCKKCGYIFTQNPFSTEKLENRYKNESKFEFDSKSNIQNEKAEYVERSKRNKYFIDECVGSISSILEIGAASGYNLSLYKCYSYGIEPSKINCILAKKNYNVDMFCGSFREYMAEKSLEKYDLVYLGMILEHIVDPMAFLREVKKINDRFIFIEVPTLDIKNIDEPFGMFCEEHVSMFTFESLNKMMDTLGYGLVDARIELGFNKGYPAGWPALDTIWEKGKKTVKYYPSLNSKLLFELYVEKSKNALVKLKKIIDDIPIDIPLAIWGTGHHVSMMLKNTSLSKKNIICFYDSDSRKYRYQMHGKNIMKYDPEDIISGKIGGIVIGSYIFQEEIAEIILKSGVDCPIYKLYEKK